MTLRASLVVPLIAAALSMIGAEKAAFISGVWQGDANYDAEGKFSDCTHDRAGGERRPDRLRHQQILTSGDW